MVGWRSRRHARAIIASRPCYLCGGLGLFSARWRAVGGLIFTLFVFALGSIAPCLNLVSIHALKGTTMMNSC
jgi:hypothetical protein